MPIAATRLVAGVGQLGMHGSGIFWSSAVELADQVGVIGSLLAVIGMVVLATRAAVLTAWLALTVTTSVLFAHSVERAASSAGARAALPFGISVTCVFACAGLLHVSSRLGRARAAATFALAAMVVLSPAMDSFRGWRRPALPIRLLDRALERAEVNSLVCPGTAEMDGLFRLAHAQGLRPDLEIGRCGGK
jgi:hypothetical protein